MRPEDEPDRPVPGAGPEVPTNPGHDGETQRPPSPHASRRRMLSWFAAALVLAAAAGGAAYYKVTDDAADRVVTRWRESPADCEGAKVRPGEGDDSSYTPRAVVVTEGFRCTVVVEVRNLSERTVHVDHAVAPMVGNQTGMVVKVDPLEHPQRTHRDDLDPERPGMDAYVEVADGLDLAPGERATFDVRLVYNPRGCNNGTTITVEGWPEVHFSVLGRGFTRPAADALVFQGDDRAPGCRGWG
jgi:hypothetical protein